MITQNSNTRSKTAMAASHCWVPFFVGMGMLLAGMACKRENPLQTELQNSFGNYLKALESRREQALRDTVFFPDTTDYAKRVQDLIIRYLDQAMDPGKIDFDPQGVVLCRFLGLGYHRYLVQGIETKEDGGVASMRIGVHFAYDNNIRMTAFEEGTKVFIPGKPWGRVLTIVVGNENPIPREQLAYAEIEIEFKKTNREGLWQVRSCQVDETSLRYEISLKNDF